MLNDRKLRYIAGLLGSAFLAYITNASRDDIEARVDGDRESLGGESESMLISALNLAAGLVPDPPVIPAFVPDGGYPDGSPADRMRRFAWVDIEDLGLSYANLGRQRSGGAVPVPPGGLDPAGEALANAAIDYYPATLLPPPRPDQPFPELPLISQARRQAFEAAIATDGSLAPLLEAKATVWSSAITTRTFKSL